MHIFHGSIPDRPLTNIDFSTYARELEIPLFRGVFLRNKLPPYPFNIVNLNTCDQSGSHRVCYYRNGSDRFYFDSYGQITPLEIQRYLKTGSEFKRGAELMQRNKDIVQAAYTSVCGHVYLFVLKSLPNGEKFQSILNHMRHH